MEIYRDRKARDLYFLQEKYLEDILDRLNTTLCAPVESTLPSDFKSKAATDGEFDKQNISHIHSLWALYYILQLSRTQFRYFLEIK
jgi:hypothetical protein